MTITTTSSAVPQAKKQRKPWIDNLRGLAMILVLLAHTEIYYRGEIVNYNIYGVDCLIIFFFLSGYLMYRETEFNLKNKVKSVFRYIVLPYFIFTIALALPKSIVYGASLDIKETARDIIMGNGSWFVAALALSELIFSTVLYLSKKNTKCLWATAIIAFPLSIYMSYSPMPLFWQADNALQALLFITIGYTYHKYEALLDKYNKPLTIILLFALLLLLKWLEYIYGTKMIVWRIDINNYPLFLADTIVCAIMMTMIFKRLPDFPLLNWTGRHTLVYYFFCGGVPLLTSKLLMRIGIPYNGNYLLILAAFALVYPVTSALVWVVYRYLPFTVGKWKSRV